MDTERFDRLVKAWTTTGSRRRVLGGLLVAAVAGLRPAWTVSAQEEIAAAGNGGTADASANGGAVATGDVNSGENAGNAIGVGDTVGGVEVDGGAAANATSLDVSADGGTAIGDASGGDDNVAFDVEIGSEPGPGPSPDPSPGPGPGPGPGPNPTPGFAPFCPCEAGRVLCAGANGHSPKCCPDNPDPCGRARSGAVCCGGDSIGCVSTPGICLA